MLTKEEVFEKVATHLLTQGARSRDSEQCLYRGPNGLKCAVGCLISDEAYSTLLEGSVSTSAVVRLALCESGIDVGDVVYLLQDLQDLHDEEQVCDWKLGLRKLADRYGIEHPEVLR